jgi:hypothetical protein
MKKKRERVGRGYLTVGELKKFIAEYKIPDDANVYYQRIEDVYFNKYGWDKSVCTVKKPDSDFKQGEKDTFVAVWSYIKFKDDDSLFLTAHY